VFVGTVYSEEYLVCMYGNLLKGSVLLWPFRF